MRITLSGKKVLEIGRLLDEGGWAAMSTDQRKVFCKRHMLHHFGISEELVDLPNRYINVSRHPVLWQNLDKLPPGIARMRELPRFGDRLGECFDHGWINMTTTREQLDALYERLFGVPIASRHPKPS